MLTVKICAICDEFQQEYIWFYFDWINYNPYSRADSASDIMKMTLTCNSIIQFRYYIVWPEKKQACEKCTSRATEWSRRKRVIIFKVTLSGNVIYERFECIRSEVNKLVDIQLKLVFAWITWNWDNSMCVKTRICTPIRFKYIQYTK